MADTKFFLGKRGKKKTRTSRISRKVIIVGLTAVLIIFPRYFFHRPTEGASHLDSKRLFDNYINDDGLKH